MNRVAVLGVCVACASASAEPSPPVKLQLAPVCEAGAKTPSALDVALTVTKLDGPPQFRLDDSLMGTPGMEALITDVKMSDDRGAIVVRRTVTTGGGKELVVTGSRLAVGAVTLRYRAHSVAASASGAREGLRHDDTGISGLGAAFLLLPELAGHHQISIEWPAATCGVFDTATTFSFQSPVVVSVELGDLRDAAYAAGHFKKLAHDDHSLHVRSAWLGAPAFDVATAAAWAARAFTAERQFFGDDDPAPYHVFVRVLAQMTDRSNGTGQRTSFLSAIGPATPWGLRLRNNISHEMMHRWLGRTIWLRGPDGTGLWFTEGFDVYYAPKLMLRAGLISPDEYLEVLDITVSRLIANPHASASNAEIGRDFFRDDVLSVVPYSRGALYAAELDAAIRTASHGRRSLDDVMRALVRVGHELPATAVRDAVQRELGAAGVARYDAVIEHGAMPEPPSDAFGPCYQRVPRRYAVLAIGWPLQITYRDGVAWERVTSVPDARCAQ